MIFLSFIAGLLVSKWVENLIVRSCLKVTSKTKWFQPIKNYAVENEIRPEGKGKIVSLKTLDLTKEMEQAKTLDEMLDYAGGQVQEE